MNSIHQNASQFKWHQITLILLLLLFKNLFLKAQDCSSNGKWDLDYEFGDGTDLETPKVLSMVDKYVFESNYTINIVVCNEDYYYANDEEIEEYTYVLEDDYLWRLR